MSKVEFTKQKKVGRIPPHDVTQSCPSLFVEKKNPFSELDESTLQHQSSGVKKLSVAQKRSPPVSMTPLIREPKETTRKKVEIKKIVQQKPTPQKSNIDIPTLAMFKGSCLFIYPSFWVSIWSFRGCKWLIKTSGIWEVGKIKIINSSNPNCYCWFNVQKSSVRKPPFGCFWNLGLNNGKNYISTGYIYIYSRIS